MTEAELNALADQARLDQRAKGTDHLHADLATLEAVGDRMGYDWEAYHSKTPCQVCNDWRAGERVLCYAYNKTAHGPHRLTRSNDFDPLELGACLSCFTAWQ